MARRPMSFAAGMARARLWYARVAVEGGALAYLNRVGRPIRYAYVPRRTRSPRTRRCSPATRAARRCRARAGRSPTELVTDLVAAGSRIAPITLHTGVSSQDAGEPPQPERFAVPATTARLVNLTRAAGRAGGRGRARR